MGRIVEDLIPVLLEGRKSVNVGKRCFIRNGKCGQKKKELFLKMFNVAGLYVGTARQGYSKHTVALPCSLTIVS